MERLFSFLYSSALVSGALTAYYWLALRNRKLHGYNRFYLLGALALSLALPLVRIDWAPVGFAAGRAVQRTPAGVGSVSPVVYIACGCAVVSAGLLLLTMWRIVQVFRLAHSMAARRMPGYTLIETDDPRAPFSFFHQLFWRRGADPEEPVNQKIFHHELAHIRGRHSWDGLFAQALCCIFWMNPFFWLLRRELAVVHEFIADAATGMEGDGEGFARMLLQSVNGGRFLEPAQGFFQSPVRRRLSMVVGGRGSRFSLWRKTLAAPVVLAVMLMVSCSKEAPDAIDQVKLRKEKLDLKIKNLMLSGVLKKQLILVSGSSGDSIDNIKRQMDAKVLLLGRP